MKELLLQQRPGAPHGETRELSSSNGAETTPSGGSGLLLVVPVCVCMHVFVCVYVCVVPGCQKLYLLLLGNQQHLLREKRRRRRNTEARPRPLKKKKKESPALTEGRHLARFNSFFSRLCSLTERERERERTGLDQLFFCSRQSRHFLP